eukprot:Gb_38748 [translate_table: standard]
MTEAKSKSASPSKIVDNSRYTRSASRRTQSLRNIKVPRFSRSEWSSRKWCSRNITRWRKCGASLAMHACTSKTSKTTSSDGSERALKRAGKISSRNDITSVRCLSRRTAIQCNASSLVASHSLPNSLLAIVRTAPISKPSADSALIAQSSSFVSRATTLIFSSLSEIHGKIAPKISA